MQKKKNVLLSITKPCLFILLSFISPF